MLIQLLRRCKMALRFRSVIPYAIPGLLALLGYWWIYSRRKKHVNYHNKQAIVIGEEQQEEVPVKDSSPKPEACVPRRRPLSSEEECPEDQTSAPLRPAGSMTPSLLCQAHERLDLPRGLPDPSVMTLQPSALEDDSEKLETIGSRDESDVPACVSAPLVSRSAVCRGGAAASLRPDSGSSANQDQWPSASAALAQKSLGITEEIGKAEQSDDSSFKPPKESRMPEAVLSDTGSVTALCLGSEKEANTPQAFLSNEVVSSHKDSAVNMLLARLEPACLEQAREEEVSEATARTVPVCQEEGTQPKGDGLERGKMGRVSLDKEEVEKIEQVAIQIISKVILAATEEVLSGAAGDVSARICQTAASRVERPLGMASAVSSDQMPAEKAMGADESVAAVLTSTQREERDQSVTDSGCLTHGCLSSPVQGDTEDHQMKSSVCSEAVLRGAAGDVSARACRAAAGRVEGALETRSAVSSGQMLAEKAMGADESVAAVLTSTQREERDQSVTDSGCLTHGCSSGPVQGDTTDCQVKNSVCSESQAVHRTPVENHGLEKSPLVMEDSGYSTRTSDGGTGAEDPLQNTTLFAASGQHSDSLSASAEQSSVPSENPPLKLPEDNTVPYSNGILNEDGPDLAHECSRAAGMDGDHSGGSDVNDMDFVDSGCAMRKTVTRQNSKLRGESSKSDYVIWEIEVPKELVGRLIGKQGRYMTFLRQASGAKIYVSTLPYFRDSQVCHIEGSSQQVEKVLSLIGKKFKELCLTNIYAIPPPTPLTLHSLLMTAWLFLPDGVTVEVVVANQVDAGHMFLQQHTHPTFHVLRSLDQQMYACYSQPEIPTLPTPVEVGIICAAPGLDGAWLRAQVISYFEETGEVELRYVDYGGYDKVKVDTLRQIRSDFLSLPFQGAEVLLDNVVPLPDEDHFSSEADAAVREMTRGAVLVAQVTNYDSATGLPLIQLWNLTGDEMVSVNRTLVERGFAQWLDY
ncbi:A-kinase anchor protein 1, mitochondrial [Patagioenas fasciata monilis]|uniref:A-kinase anchor protein 1, mitochondrial n=1 Tax=Patagioenas fasciata monilis TaxID=372326 RepID=A0A1V4K3J6_PATFA|nr:A-kinase anchor protein 1, mitochondrial [Patagioenas fasciata monilis]